jgi:hypothetical protein
MPPGDPVNNVHDQDKEVIEERTFDHNSLRLQRMKSCEGSETDGFICIMNKRNI